MLNYHEMETHNGPHWLQPLAATRQDPQAEAVNCRSDQQFRAKTTIERVSGPIGRDALILTFPSFADSSAAVAQLLSQQFSVRQDAGGSGRARQHPLAQAVHIEALPPASDEELRIKFTARSDAGEARVQDVATLFEAALHFHVKTTKSELHSRMRARLGALSQQLQSARQPTLSEER